jgi:peptide/nickel transport system permease protein
MATTITTSPALPHIGAEEARSRSYMQEAIDRTLADWRTRLGAVWIAIVFCIAVLSPFLASSHPLLVKENGRWSSPVLRHLTPVDVLLLIVAPVVVVMLFQRRMTGRAKLGIIVGALALFTPLCFLLIHPPKIVVYEKYRQAWQAHRPEVVLMPLIPYSASDRLRDQSDVALRPPSTEHLCGTEDNGADVLSRVIHASRLALAIGFISTGIAVLLGVLIGAPMGYFAGKVDLLGMRVIEVFQAIPQLYLLIACVAFFGRNLYLMMAIIGATSWSGYARFIRAEFLKLRNQEFVQAAIAAGLPTWSVLFRHMLPNGITPLLVSATFGVASAIQLEATLSFLGLGLVDEPSWGQLLNQARGVSGVFSWWLAVFPGLAIFLTVYAYNLVGESLRDALDPKLKKLH